MNDQNGENYFAKNLFKWFNIDRREQLVMQNKNLDPISNIRAIKRPKRLKPTGVDAVIKVKKPAVTRVLATETPFTEVPFSWNWQRIFGYKLVWGLGVFVMAFAFGMYFTWHTHKSQAEPVAVVTTDDSAVPTLPVVAGASALGPINQVPNEILFNLTLDQLEDYLKEALKTPEMKAAESLAERKEKLKAYLADKNSPLINIVDTLAELKHWKLVLAISNSESSLGRRCYENNCSGIGVEPGHPLWRSYKTKADWAKDLDRLLDRRYKNWTLEKMNGVYNQPGSENWLMASKQILEEMQERGIE